MVDHIKLHVPVHFTGCNVYLFCNLIPWLIIIQLYQVRVHVSLIDICVRYSDDEVFVVMISM